MAANTTRSFDRKDLSIERSGTASVAMTSPHAEFLGQRSGRLFRRSGAKEDGRRRGQADAEVVMCSIYMLLRPERSLD
jgi:hypothetical protein